jgi:hypothetical protein
MPDRVDWLIVTQSFSTSAALHGLTQQRLPLKVVVDKSGANYAAIENFNMLLMLAWQG